MDSAAKIPSLAALLWIGKCLFIRSKKPLIRFTRKLRGGDPTVTVHRVFHHENKQ